MVLGGVLGVLGGEGVWAVFGGSRGGGGVRGVSGEGGGHTTSTDGPAQPFKMVTGLFNSSSKHFATGANEHFSAALPSSRPSV